MIIMKVFHTKLAAPTYTSNEARAEREVHSSRSCHRIVWLDYEWTRSTCSELITCHGSICLAHLGTYKLPRGSIQGVHQVAILEDGFNPCRPLPCNASAWNGRTTKYNEKRCVSATKHAQTRTFIYVNIDR